jgi:hypothetical protein
MNTGRIAGLFYLGTFAAGMIALAAGSSMAVANGVATVCYVGVTALFYVIFRRVNPTVAAIAAVIGFAGCAANVLLALHRPSPVNPLAIFGCYCILIGYLVAASSFMPRLLGIAMAIGGVSWLTFGVPAVARALVPFNYAPGILAEGALTVWLLVKGAGDDAADHARAISRSRGA